MKFTLIVCLICMALGSASADWRYKLDNTTAGLSGISIAGTAVSLTAGVPRGVVIEEIGSQDGKLVRLPKTDRYSVKLDTKRSGDALLVTADITDTRGGDSAADVVYQIPIDVAGWVWHQTIYTSAPTGDGGSQTQMPISVLTDPKTGAGLAVAITPETPCMFEAVPGKRSSMTSETG